MDELKRFIEQNRAQFDDAEPMAGHFERFQQRLDAEHKTSSNNLAFWLKIAAVMIISATLGGTAAGKLIGRSTEKIVSEVVSDSTQTHQIVERTTQLVAERNSPEFAQTQNYYIELVDNRLDQIKATSSIDEQQKTELLKEMSQIDELFGQLQKDLKNNPDNPALIDAMITHYQIKVEVLNQIINNLNNIKQLNTQENEKVDL